MALLQEFIIGTSFSLAYLFYLSKNSADWKKQIFLPSQKIKSSLQRSALMILIIGGIITLLVTGLSASTLGWFMYHKGIAPKDYIDFLEYSKKLTFIKSQSGGYVFRHDLFQEYFQKNGKKYEPNPISPSRKNW